MVGGRGVGKIEPKLRRDKGHLRRKPWTLAAKDLIFKTALESSLFQVWEYS